jgi:hypothetical protein
MIRRTGERPPIAAAVHSRGGVRRWKLRPAALSFDGSAGSPWLLVPPDVRKAFDAVAAAGIPLSETEFGPPLLGVKCGCNAAFLVSLDSHDSPDDDVARVRSIGPAAATRTGVVERWMLRPVVRGRTIPGWQTTPGSQRAAHAPQWILWTHETADGVPDLPMRALPPAAARWLAPWRHRLAARSDTHGRGPWWALFRTDSASTRSPRVVWSDLGQVSRATVLPVGDPTVPLNSCYAVGAPSETDAHALCAIINSPIAAAWLNVLAEPARGGFHRYLAWTVGLLPLPVNWARARAILGVIGGRIAGGSVPGRGELSEAVAAAYDLSAGALAPLLSWPEE